ASVLIAMTIIPRQESASGPGFFRAEERQGIWWLIDPSGKPPPPIAVAQIANEPDGIRGPGPPPYRKPVSKLHPAGNAWDLAALACRPRSHDPLLIGYFSDNELRWGSDWRGKENMLQMYLAMPEGAAGRKRATDFLRERYASDIAKLRQAWSAVAADFEHLPPDSTTEAFKADSDAFLE